ncbi:hypothetical protein A5906_22690 [Bradyrhizobium sacchari]|nr:hypothetical protein A5906_22690 [Bradyrhizobium sacchari]
MCISSARVLRFGNLLVADIAGADRATLQDVTSIYLHIFIASTAKQSRIFPQRQPGLLRRKGSSQ